MPERGRDNDTPKRAPTKKDDKQNRAPRESHRLRGEELADDFVDAEGDSCAVTRHRDEKESES